MNLNYEQYNKSVLKLYYMFLKERGLFAKLYGKYGRLIPTIYASPRNFCFSLENFSLTYTSRLLRGATMAGVESSSDDYLKLLQYSQLWRIYVFNNLDKVDLESVDTDESKVKESLLYEVKKNGSRGLDEIRDFIKNH